MNYKFKDILFVGIILFLVVTGINATTYLYNANEVSYDNSNSNLVSTDVQSALDELYTKCNNSTTTCPSGHTCTDKTNIKCKRATALHTEKCTNNDTSYYCQGDGYALNDTITYGNTSTIEGVLTVGDAFDCDVNGDGVYDAATERFYYVSDYFDTSSKSFNDKVAVLVYYSNTDDGVASTTNVAYSSIADAQAIGPCAYSLGCNWYGPITATGDLPTTMQWSNISLYKETRQILAQNNATATSGGTLPVSFSYSGYSARLLTYQEIYHNCFDYYIAAIYSKNGLSTNCKFLFERTKYTNSNSETNGGWTETPSDSGTYDVYHWYSYYCALNRDDYVATIVAYGTRPAIEVPKSEILY